MTNDDGHESPGSLMLASALRQAGCDVIESYPHVNASASGTAMWPLDPSVLAESEVAMPWTPSFIVNFWIDRGEAFDLVVSGINSGPNVGTSILHSGTVAAALTAIARGVPGVAISCDDRYSTFGEEDGVIDWATMADLAIRAIDFSRGEGAEHSWNVNIPAQPAKRDQGLLPTIVEVSRPSTVLKFDRLHKGGTEYVHPEFNPSDSEEVRILRRGDVALSRLRAPFLVQSE